MIRKFLFMAEKVSEDLPVGALTGRALLTLFEDAGCSLNQLAKEKLTERKGRNLEKDLLHLSLVCNKTLGVAVEVHMNCICLDWEIAVWRTLIENARDFLKKNPNWEYFKGICGAGYSTTAEFMTHVLSEIEKYLNATDSVGCQSISFRECHTLESVISVDAKTLKKTLGTFGRGTLFRECGWDTTKFLKEREDAEFLRKQLKNVCVEEIVKDGKTMSVFVDKVNTKYSREDAERRARLFGKYMSMTEGSKRVL